MYVLSNRSSETKPQGTPDNAMKGEQKIPERRTRHGAYANHKKLAFTN
jgi:hypothetical protein